MFYTNTRSPVNIGTLRTNLSSTNVTNAATAPTSSPTRTAVLMTAHSSASVALAVAILGAPDEQDDTERQDEAEQPCDSNREPTSW